MCVSGKFCFGQKRTLDCRPLGAASRVCMGRWKIGDVIFDTPNTRDRNSQSYSISCLILFHEAINTGGHVTEVRDWRRLVAAWRRRVRNMLAAAEGR